MSVSDAPFWAWWLVPVLVTALVVSVVALSRRERRPKHGYDAIDDYARFRTAMAHVRDQRPAARGPSGDDEEHG